MISNLGQVKDSKIHYFWTGQNKNVTERSRMITKIGSPLHHGTETFSSSTEENLRTTSIIHVFLSDISQ